jgi:hypothetical protein
MSSLSSGRNNQKKNECLDVLRRAAGYAKGEGTFWVPQSAYQDLGFSLGHGINPALSKIYEYESKSTRHKNDDRCRNYMKR